MGATSGKVYHETQVANLAEADLQAKIARSGNFDINDVKFHNGVWKVEAEDSGGMDFEMRINAASGEVISKLSG